MSSETLVDACRKYLSGEEMKALAAAVVLAEWQCPGSEVPALRSVVAVIDPTDRFATAGAALRAFESRNVAQAETLFRKARDDKQGGGQGLTLNGLNCRTKR